MKNLKLITLFWFIPQILLPIYGLIAFPGLTLKEIIDVQLLPNILVIIILFQLYLYERIKELSNFSFYKLDKSISEIKKYEKN